MLKNWQYKKYNCIQCGNTLEFRVAYKSLQFSQILWVNVDNNAAVILCPKCGKTFWIPEELRVLQNEG